MANHKPIAPRLPYVGVAAVRTMDQVTALRGMSALLGPGQVLAAGVQVSDKTLRGQDNSYPAIFPPISELADLLRPAESSGMELHVHFSPEVRTDLLSKLQQLAQLAGDLIHGIQINQSFPDVTALAWWRQAFPEHRIILPVTRKSLERATHHPQSLYEQLCEYDGVATDLLFDQSGGRGELLSHGDVRHYLRPLAANWPELRRGVAGGLGPVNMSPVADLLNTEWPLNWDAQSQLCSGDTGLDLVKAELFIRLSGCLIGWVRP